MPSRAQATPAASFTTRRPMVWPGSLARIVLPAAPSPRRLRIPFLKMRRRSMLPLTTFEDSLLIKLTLAGQTECFTVLTNRHLPAVRRRIGSIVPNTADADDILQEVLLKAWRHLSAFRSESSFRTWMISVAINEAPQIYRLQQRRPVCQELGNSDAFVSLIESPLQSLTRAETIGLVRKAVVELPAKYRQVLILRDLAQLSERETAQALRLSVSTAKSRHYRARLMLLTALTRPRIPNR